MTKLKNGEKCVKSWQHWSSNLSAKTIHEIHAQPCFAGTKSAKCKKLCGLHIVEKTDIVNCDTPIQIKKAKSTNYTKSKLRTQTIILTKKICNFLVPKQKCVGFEIKTKSLTAKYICRICA